MIQQGACNPSGIARSLVEAIDSARADCADTDSVRKDPAVRMIAHQLAFLLNLAEYDHDSAAYSRDYRLCEERAKEVDDQLAAYRATQADSAS
jgi:hypothetical protein